MKNTGRQLMKMVNQMSDEIRLRYPNLYQSLSENRVHQILEGLLEDSENTSMQLRSMRVSDYVNRKRGFNI